MISITSKICIVGDFAVGKTSVTERFVNNHFSEKYLTTVGVKIDTREIECPDRGITHKLVIWDVAGSDRFDSAQLAYLRGASGYIYVADGTRANTLRSLVYLKEQLTELYDDPPAIALVNKSDLHTDWEANEEHIDVLRTQIGNVFKTSAKTGDGVEHAIDSLADRILDKIQQQS
jgi:small GTP-binding protein